MPRSGSGLPTPDTPPREITGSPTKRTSASLILPTSKTSGRSTRRETAKRSRSIVDESLGGLRHLLGDPVSSTALGRVTCERGRVAPDLHADLAVTIRSRQRFTERLAMASQ